MTLQYHNLFHPQMRYISNRTMGNFLRKSTPEFSFTCVNHAPVSSCCQGDDYGDDAHQDMNTSPYFLYSWSYYPIDCLTPYENMKESSVWYLEFMRCKAEAIDLMMQDGGEKSHLFIYEMNTSLGNSYKLVYESIVDFDKETMV